MKIYISIFFSIVHFVTTLWATFDSPPLSVDIFPPTYKLFFVFG